MDGWVKIDGNQPIKYVNRQNIVSINDVGGGRCRHDVERRHC